MWNVYLGFAIYPNACGRDVCGVSWCSRPGSVVAEAGDLRTVFKCFLKFGCLVPSPLPPNPNPRWKRLPYFLPLLCLKDLNGENTVHFILGF